MSSQPNIVLIMADQWRGDCLSIDGHPVVQTPYLDQLATDGARFTRAFTATPTCIPARAGLHTGQCPRTHGRVGYRDGVPWDYPVTMAGELARAGYQTQAVGKMHVYPERSQMGFQNVILHDGYLHFARNRRRDIGLIDDYIPWLREQVGRDADYFDHGVNCNSIVARPWDKEEYLHPTNYVTSQAIDFLRRRDPRKPFFLFVSYHRPHPPYDPPGWAFDMYRDMAMPPVPVGDWADVMAPYARPGRPDAFVGEADPVALQRARAGYYGHMSHIDGQVNRLLELLAEYGLADDSYVCFTADHGEMMGDHHMWRKAYPYEGSAHVPLILKGPAGSDVVAGCEPDQPVELRDLMPTFLEAAGAPVPASVEGRSLLPLAASRPAAWRPYLHGEHTVLEQSLQWVTDGRDKYIWFSGTGHEQLFDLEADPQELHDLARDPGQSERVGYWRQRLIAELRDREEGFVQDGRLIPGRPVDAVLAHLREQAAEYLDRPKGSWERF